MLSLPKDALLQLAKQFTKEGSFFESVAAYLVNSFGTRVSKVFLHFVEEGLSGAHMQFGIESYHGFATFLY